MKALQFIQRTATPFYQEKPCSITCFTMEKVAWLQVIQIAKNSKHYKYFKDD